MPNIIELNVVSKDFVAPISFRRLLKLDFKSVNPTRALDNISFTLPEGMISVILGSNGAGKTTLLKVISTLLLPNKGKIIINGLESDKYEEKIKPLIGFVFPGETTFYRRLNGRENLEFFAALYGLNKKTARLRINELLGFFGIDFENRRFDNYSTGMQQKLSLIRALLHNPRILLMDEPTKSLDYQSALSLRRFIKEELVKKEARTAIIATHNFQEALFFGDIFLIMDKGKLLACGPLAELQKTVNCPNAALDEIYLKLSKKKI